MVKSDKTIRQRFHELALTDQITGPPDPAAEWEPVISIGTAAAMAGLSVSSLRKYENEGLLIYHRTATGRRLLCRADIKRINMIQHLINDVGLNIEGIRRLLALLPCWDLKLCSPKNKKKCKAPHDVLRPCWMVRETEGSQSGHHCRTCEVYRYGAYCAVTMKMLVHGTDSTGG
jgi:MerR family transcriptional regulator/heat shock protein HspR